MRLLLAVNNPSAHLYPLPHGWADRGHDVEILMDSPTGRFGHAREFVHAGVQQSLLGPDGSVLDAVTGRPRSVSFEELIRHADAVVLGGYATRVARRILRARASAVTHKVLLAERPFPRPPGPRTWVRDTWARWVVSRVDAVWSMSRAGDLAFERLGKAPEAHVPYPIVMPPRPSGITSDGAEKWSAEGEVRILLLGQLIERKRPLVAVEVVRSLHARGADVRGDVAGAGELEEQVRAAASGLPVVLHGHVPPSTVERMLHDSHVLLHPASHDGWGFAVVEAASRGTPVVATQGCDAATELAARTPWVRVTDGSPSSMAQRRLRS
jgi:glycosyltransferase involved in cell wall biosynthesis